MKHRKKKRISKQRMTVFALFGIYTFIMIWLLFFHQRYIHDYDVNYFHYIKNNINMLPFKTISSYASDLIKSSVEFSGVPFINLSGNIVLFIPLGIFLPTIWRKLRKFTAFLLTVCIAIAAVEIIQLFTLMGVCDIDDLIFNVLGAIIGFGLWKLKPILKILHKYKII